MNAVGWLGGEGYQIIIHKEIHLEGPQLTPEHEVISKLSARIAELEHELEQLKYDLPVYCPTCKGCGEAGCCSPSACKVVVCLYGEQNVKDYRELEAEIERLSKPCPACGYHGDPDYSPES